LLNLGHTRIACITNAPISYTAAKERLKGYRQALEDAGIGYDASLVRYGEFSVESGYCQMSELLSGQPDFTAAFVASDTLAYGAMAAIRERGLTIPQDIALVGLDDLPLSRFIDPPLTSVHLPAAELASQAAGILFQILQEEQPAQKQVILDTHLVVRESCGASLSG
jgi:LacI family transcriptional regulator